MLKWSKLKEGDVVDIVAPGFKTTKEELVAASKLVEGMGLRPRIQKGIFSKSLLCSASDDVRAEQLIHALKAKDSKMVWCLRGGYGSQRLLPYLGKVRKPKQAKLLMGYSDVTAIHNVLNQKWGWTSIHGPVLTGVKSPAELKHIKAFVFGDSDYQEYGGLKAFNPASFRARSTKANLCGGNLTVINTGLGTDWALNPRSNILFLEDVGERGYSLDRMLVQLRHAGFFKSVKAIVLGDFIAGDEPGGRSLVQASLKEFFSELDVPVFKGLKVGHGRINKPIALGAKAELKIGKEITLKVECGFKS